MVSDLFSCFDYGFGSVMWGSGMVVWLSSFIFLLMLLNSSDFFYSTSRFGSFFYSLGGMMVENLSIYGVSMFGGVYIFFVSLMVMLCFFNIIGVGPYVFKASAHFCFTLSISIGIWTGLAVYNLFSGWNGLFRHSFFSSLVVSDLPVVAAMGMIWIEVLSNFVRAFTLGLRLAMNIFSGQILIGFLGAFSGVIMLPNIIIPSGVLPSLMAFSVGITSVLCFMAGMVLAVAEFCIAILQAFLFLFLVLMYFEEVVRK